MARHALVIAVGLLATVRASAQSAKELYVSASSAYARGEFSVAAKEFEASYRLEPHAAILYNAALAWQQAHEDLRAAEDFSRALDALLADAQANDARARLAVLDSKLAIVDVRAPAGARIEIDDTDTQAAGHPRARLVPGEHSIRAIVGSRTVERTLALEAGATTTIDLVPDFAPKAAPASVRGARHAVWSNQKTMAVIAAGAGTVALASGVVAGIIAIADKSTVDAQCHGTTICDGPDAIGAASEGRAMAAVGTVAFVIGILGIGGGAALYFSDRSDRSDRGIAVGPASVRGTF